MDAMTILGMVLIGLVTYWFLSQFFRGNQPPGPMPLPYIGNVFTMSKRPKQAHLTFKELADYYGPIYQLSFGPVKTVVLNTPELIRECFVKQGANFSARPLEQMLVSRLITDGGKGIVWSSEHNKQIRKFSLVSLRGLGLGKSSLEEKVREETEALCQSFQKETHQPFNPSILIQSAVSNIICSIVFGKRYEYDDEELCEYLRKLQYQFENVNLGDPAEFFPILTAFGIPKRLQKEVNQYYELLKFVDKHIEEHRSSYNSEHIRDFVDLYFKEEAKGSEQEKAISLDQFRYIINDLFAAGTETTGTTLKWGLILMMHHQDVQKKCRDELQNLCGANQVPSNNDKSKLPYIEATVLEIQRMANIAPMSLPHLAQEEAVVGGYTISKGSIVLGNQYKVHMDPNNFKDPESFNPDRWIDGDGKILKSDAFLPFSIGPRVCLGEALARMELFLFFSGLIQNFQIDFDPGSPKPTLNDGIMGITLGPKPYKIKLTPI